MNCRAFERLIALDVEGDLPQSQGRAVAEHLLACPSCRKFTESLKTSQSLLKDLGQEPVDDQILAEVRRRVRIGLASEQEPKGFPVWRLVLGAGLVAALILVVEVNRQYSSGVSTRMVAKRLTPANTAVPSRARNDEARNSKFDFTSAKSASSLVGNPARATKQKLSAGVPSLARTLDGSQDVPSTEFSPGALRAGADLQHSPSLTIKLLTDNPNVVIYWLVD